MLGLEKLKPNHINLRIMAICDNFNPAMLACGVKYHEKDNGIFFHTVKDTFSKDNEPELQSLHLALEQILAIKKNFTNKLYFPVHQCRGMAKLNWRLMGSNIVKRHHVVLVVVDVNKGIVENISAHDSQSKVIYFLYPDKLKDIAEIYAKQGKLSRKAIYNSAKHYHCYDQQKSDYECGRYVLIYLKELIKGNGINNFPKIGNRDVLYNKDTQAFLDSFLSKEQQDNLTNYFEQEAKKAEELEVIVDVPEPDF